MRFAWTVKLTPIKEYGGRDEHGKIKLSIRGGGIPMTESCATQLAAKLRPLYPEATASEIYTQDPIIDDLPASLAELGEDGSVILRKAIWDALAAGLTKLQILDVLDEEC
jgi:hypothetical protein